MTDRETDRQIIGQIIARRPGGITAQRVAKNGLENELDLWKLQRAMAAVHDIDLRRWSHRDARFVDMVKTARRDLWRAYTVGYVAGLEIGVDDDAEQGDS